MGALKWLNRLRRNESGNVLVIGAASMPLLIGATALAVDTVQLSLWKRQLQRAADSGAIAGVYAMAQGAEQDSAVSNDLDEHIDNDLDENETPALRDIKVASGSFAEGAISATDDCDVRGAALCYNRAVRVDLEAQRWLPFMSFFTRAPTTLRAGAVAALVDDGKYCLISLYDGDDPGITATGNGDVKLHCGMATNSTADPAITADGSSKVEATPLASVGGLTGSTHFVGETTLQPYSAPQPDPLAHIPNPPNSKYSNCKSLSDFPDGIIKMNSDGEVCLNSPDFQSAYTFQNTSGKPGAVYVKGDTHFNAQAKVTGDNIVMILGGVDGAAGNLQMNGSAEINLSAPTSGDYEGVVLYRDRRAPLIEVKFNGGAGLNLNGALYFPNTDITINGNFDLTAQCLQLVVRKINFQGAAEIENNCPPGGPNAFSRPVARLVS